MPPNQWITNQYQWTWTEPMQDNGATTTISEDTEASTPIASNPI
jgi:hypothetical protein